MQAPDTSALLEHAGFVRALAFGVLGRDDLTDDALQETFLAALRGPAAPSGRLRAWLGSIGRRRAIDLYRRELTRRRHEAAAPPARETSTPDDLAQRADLGRRMTHAVLALDPPYRDALLLRYYEGLSPRAISRRLALPVETVRTHVKRALARLRESLDADGRGRERWLSGVAALVGDQPGGDARSASEAATSMARVARPGAIVTAAAVLVTAMVAGVVIMWRDAKPKHMTGDSLASAALIASTGGAIGAAAGGPVVPPPPPADPAPAMLQPAPKPAPRAAAPVPPFAVEVTAEGPAPATGAVVEVTVRGEPARRMATDGVGRATFDLPQDAIARVFVEAKGMASRTFERLSTAKWRSEPFPVALEKGGGVVGRVVDARTGAPVADARILSAGGGVIGSRSNSGGEPSYGETVTDADGRYRLDGLPRDWIVTLSASARKYRRADTPVIVDRDDRTTAADLRLDAGGWVKALVKGPDGGPIVGALVAARLDVSMTETRSPHGASGSTATLLGESPIAESVTGADGSCELVGLPLGTAIHLRAEAPPASAAAAHDVGPLTPEKPDAAVTLTLRRAARVRVLLAGDATPPLADVRILVDGVDVEGEIREAGRIDVGGLDPGEHSFVVTAPGRRGTSFDVELAEGQSFEKPVRWELGATVAGVVRDETGAPMPGRVVYATGADSGKHPGQEAVTDAGGKFLISGLDADATYALSASDASATQADPVEVKAPAKDVALTVGRLARVIVHVKLPRGGAVPDELNRVVVLADGTSQGDGAAWDDGAVEFDYAGGRATVKLTAPGYVAWSKTIEAARGTTLDLGEIELDAGLSIEGDVVDAEGRPMPGASVLRAAGDHPSSTGEYAVEEFCVPSPCDATGGFHVTTLPRGPSTLTAWAEGYLPAGVRVDPTSSGRTRPRLVMRRGCLVRVRVTDGRGAPVEGSTVAFVPLDARGVAGEADERESSGAVLSHRIPAGRWRIRVDDLSTDVDVEEGTERTITLRRP